MPGKLYEMPGVSTADGYVPTPVAGVEDVLHGALADASAALAEQAEREAALPADPGLVNVRVGIRREMEAFATTDAARVKAHYDDPHRSRYSKEGLNELDREFESQRADERAARKTRLETRLENIETAVRERLADANALPVGQEDDGIALQFAAMLSHTTPSQGLTLLADFVGDASPAVAYSALPLLRSMCERGNWAGSYELARAVETLTRMVEERPGAARVAADLQLLDETKRQLDYLVSASADVVAPRFVAGSDVKVLPDGRRVYVPGEIPAPGRAGFNLVFSGSDAARELFGDGPSLRDASAAEPEKSFWDLNKPEPSRNFRRFNSNSEKQRAADAAADEE